MVLLFLVPPTLARPAFSATLDDIPPACDQILAAPVRLKLVLGCAAVLDKETGLVWERSPDASTKKWYAAVYCCVGKDLSRRKGWRLPTFEELASLVDTGTDATRSLRLPAGHPFLHVQSAYFWSATTDVVDPQEAWIVGIGNGGERPNRKTGMTYTWCVRAGRGYDNR